MGSGIRIWSASVALTGCVINANSAVTSYGGGIVARCSHLDLESCAIALDKLQKK
jgi:hypothetical protein